MHYVIKSIGMLTTVKRLFLLFIAFVIERIKKQAVHESFTSYLTACIKVRVFKFENQITITEGKLKL